MEQYCKTKRFRLSSAVFNLNYNNIYEDNGVDNRKRTEPKHDITFSILYSFLEESSKISKFILMLNFPNHS
jgi:hypothetical protein